MSIPIVHLLDDPVDNEQKLWKMLQDMRLSLQGPGGPLAGWGFSSGPDGQGGTLIGNGTGSLGCGIKEDSIVAPQELTESTSVDLTAFGTTSMSYTWWVGPHREMYVWVVSSLSGGGNAFYDLPDQKLIRIVDGVITEIPKIPPVDHVPANNSPLGCSDEPIYTFSNRLYNVLKGTKVDITPEGGDSVPNVWTKYGDRWYCFPQLHLPNRVLREYNAETGGAQLNSTTAFQSAATTISAAQATAKFLWVLGEDGSTSKVWKVSKTDLSIIETIDLQTSNVFAFRVLNDSSIWFIKTEGAGHGVRMWKAGQVYPVDTSIPSTVTLGTDRHYMSIQDGEIFVGSRISEKMIVIGTVSGQGTSAANRIILLGDEGQLTPDNLNLVSLDVVNHRVGINTGCPAATLDVHTDRPDCPMQWWHTPSDHLLLDFSVNGSSVANARIREVVTSGFATRLDFMTADSSNILRERVKMDDLVEVLPAFALSGDLTPAQVTSNQNNYNPTGLATASILRVTTDSTPREFTGLAGGLPGRVILWFNMNALGGPSQTLKNQSSSSTAANRFGFSSDLVIAPQSGVILVWDDNDSRWRTIGLAPHNLLSGPHGDTVPASVVKGDLIRGNATPAWERLPRGTNDQLLQMVDDLPTWMDVQVDHLHRVARWASITSQTVFELPYLAEYIEGLYDDGTQVDPLTYTLSDDRTQVVVDSAPAGASVIVCNFVAARL